VSKQSALLSVPTSSLLLEVVEGALIIQHWGAPLQGELASVQTAICPSIANSSWDFPQFPGIMRESSRGFLGRPTLSGHRSGKAWSTKFEVTDFHHNANHVTVTFRDFHAELEVIVTFDLDKYGVLSQKEFS
jgi:alpha-galactosidase